ncbi:hypothetical protein HY990_06250 [Candidatus Micrarchaeota archaeon]|nr:hypothetical protein [Candidatus Micrarchaeota archaeon]
MKWVLILIILSVGCVSQLEQQKNPISTELIPQIPIKLPFQLELPSQECSNPVFTHHLLDPTHIKQVGQIGTVHGSGQTTEGRSYIYLKDQIKKTAIYAPTNMTFTRGAYYKVPPIVKGLGEPIPDYALYFDAGCGVEIHLGHLKEVIPEIARQFSEPKFDSRTEQLTPVKFKAGDLIGYFVTGAGVASFDFMIHDSSVVNKFANQARHEYGSSNLIHAVCPYDFYPPQMKKIYYDLIGGIGSKDCGPVSRDFSGTISGLWFLDKEVRASIYDYRQEGVYGNVLPIVGDVDRIIIGKIADRTTTPIYPNNPTYKDPKEIHSEHCYQIYQTYDLSTKNGYVFFKLVDDRTLSVFYGASGECPLSFPRTGGQIYYR